jgi:UDP:flavonoid glycosyltransferase YjiC (YdhE family)
VPQVVLPVWADTYDYAWRVEYLGIGRYGSRKASPKYTADELGPVLLDVLLGRESQNMRSKAQELASACATLGEGRDTAAKGILREMNHVD